MAISTTTYYLRIDRERTLRLYPTAERGSIFALEQRTRAYDDDNATTSMGGEVGGGNSNTMSASDRAQLLVDSFGSRKKQKVMNSRAANRVNVHSVVGSGDAMMRSVTEQRGISDENRRVMMEEGGNEKVHQVDAAYEQARRRMLPQYDVDADVPYKVYNAQSMAGVLAWEKTSRIVEKVLEKRVEATADGGDGGNKDWIAALLGKKEEHRPLSLTRLLESIDPARKGSNYRIKVVLFLHFVLKLHAKIQRGRGGTIEGGTLDDCIGKVFVPHEVGMRLFELFMSEREGGGYVASPQQKTKLHAHILVLYVIASGKEMSVPSINQLCRDMKLDAKEASLVLREAGFTVKKNGSGDVGAILSVPLTFPPPKRVTRT
ncbi:hypothetical protein ACHAXA_001412 [Cyclostephanos tholiformis]|uniref:Uncharacterized protein n=1 Tax=Cyclostephanos tholiformis TaxID=382380 RepID=A0ABD3R5K0_9STRA